MKILPKLSGCLAVFLVGPLFVGCSLNTRATEFALVNKVVSEDKNIFRIKENLEKRGFSVSNPTDPTGLGQVLWMSVHKRNSISVADSLLYASGFNSRESSSIIIVSDSSGIVNDVRY